MHIDWAPYDRFDFTASQQQPMTADQRQAIERWASDLIGIAHGDASSCRAIASPPGRFAATVIRIAASEAPRFADRADSNRIAALGLKVFKSNRDAARESERAIRFHRTQLARLPGLPHDRVQRSLDAGIFSDGSGHSRGYVVQEWMEGDSLEERLQRSQRPGLPDESCRAILAQLLNAIVIPLWSVGTVWWDFRDANFCFDERSGRLTLIDVDSLSAYADEILNTPEIWTRRDKGRWTAVARLRRMSIRVLEAREASKSSRAATRAFGEAWGTEVEPLLLALGRESQPSAAAKTVEGAIERAFAM
jgi:hypothetical protein